MQSVISACRAARITSATKAASNTPTSAGISIVSDAAIPPFAIMTVPKSPPPAKTTPVSLLHPRSVPILSYPDKPSRTEVNMCCILSPSKFDISTAKLAIQYELLTSIAAMISRGSITLSP